MVIPYITFYGECRQALEFYHEVFGGVAPVILPYGDYVPEPGNPPPVLRDWVMHAEMEICGSKFWFADEAIPVARESNIQLALQVSSTAEAKRVYDRLLDGGTTALPPTETFYSAFHASLIDRFGVRWNVVSEELPAAR